jgi:hypothetical protein
MQRLMAESTEPSTADASATDPGSTSSGPLRSSDGSSGTWLFWIAVALVLLPLAALAVHYLSASRFFAGGDTAGIELRTRDVGHHPVLLGLWSRSDWNHPGPALFYLLALPYRLVGSRTSGLQLGAILINGGAILGMALVARRRGGLPLALLTLVGCGILMNALGPVFLSDPWNPRTPVLPFGLLVLLCWSLAYGDVWALPVAVAVASFCVQTHIGYLPLAIPLLVLGCGSFALQAKRGHLEKSGLGAVNRRHLVRACVVSGVVFAVMWLPPVLDQIFRRRGNIYRVVGYFTHPDGKVATLGDGFRIVAGQFVIRPPWLSGTDKWLPSTDQPALLRSSPFPVLLLVLAIAAVVLWRRRSFEAALLALTVLVTSAFGIVAVARTIGGLFTYRLKWTWVLGMLGLVAIAWTAWLLLAPRFRRSEQRFLFPLAIGALLVLGTVNFSSAVHPKYRPTDGTTFSQSRWDLNSKVLAKLVPATIAALPHGRGDVIVRSADDPGVIYQGMQLALEQRGIPARTDDRTGIVGNGSKHRVHRQGPVRAILTVATADDVDRSVAGRKGRVIAYWGPVSARERVEIAKKRLALKRAYAARTISKTDVFLGVAAVSQRLNGPDAVVLMKVPATGADRQSPGAR